MAKARPAGRVTDVTMLKYGFPYNTLEEATSDDFQLIGSKLQVAKYLLDHFKHLKYRSDSQGRQIAKKAAEKALIDVIKSDPVLLAQIKDRL
jgi:hypothetical protein